MSRFVTSFVTLISRSWIKESTPILFQMKYMVEDIIMEPLGVVDLHIRSQECPPVSGRVPDKFPDLSFLVLDIKRSINMVRNITLKPFWGC